MVESGIKKASEIPQEQLRETNEKSQRREVSTYVSTNNPKHPDFYPIITHSISILNASTNMKQKLSNIKIIPSKRQPPNLKKILIRAKFTSQENNDNAPKVKNVRISVVKLASRSLFAVKLK